ncbi:hypothetical protein BG004_007189 [Podila humilis]|nr:hypothetical protein BG004_007189 [Podila humilis]
MVLAHLYPARLVPSAGCFTSAATAVRPTAVRSTSYSADARASRPSHINLCPAPQGTATTFTTTTTATAIPISPPPTPNNHISNHTHNVKDTWDDYLSQYDITFSNHQRPSSAPSAMSPLHMRMTPSIAEHLLLSAHDGDHTNNADTPFLKQEASTPLTKTTGFTFSSNITKDDTQEERGSYALFVDMMEEDHWKSISTVRSTYFFDGIGRGGGFLAIPHLASHGNAKTSVICRLLEAWLTKKLVEPTISDSIPVLEDNIQSSVSSIKQHLQDNARTWAAGVSKAVIYIRCGHVFMLDTCCDDETIVQLGAAEFYQDYPLFVDVEIKMLCDANQGIRDQQMTEILIAFQNVSNTFVIKELDQGTIKVQAPKNYPLEATLPANITLGNEIEVYLSSVFNGLHSSARTPRT